MCRSGVHEDRGEKSPLFFVEDTGENASVLFFE